MKKLLVLLALTAVSSAQAHVCSTAWDKQEAAHVANFRTKLEKEVKKVLIQAYSRIGTNITEADINFTTTILNRTVVDYGGGEFSISTDINYAPAVVTVSGTSTEFSVEAVRAKGYGAKYWTVNTSTYAEENYNAIGDLVSYSCDSGAEAYVDLGLANVESIEKFAIHRQSNDYWIGNTNTISSPNMSDEVQ